MTTLEQYEKYQRAHLKRVVPALDKREIFFSGLFVFICAPFLTATLLMIPLIGQALALAAFVFTLAYLWVRRSILVALSVLTGYLLFLVPFLITVQTIKHRLDVTNFFLMALGIPVVSVYCMVLAGRIWYLIEKSREG